MTLTIAVKKKGVLFQGIHQGRERADARTCMLFQSSFCSYRNGVVEPLPLVAGLVCLFSIITIKENLGTENISGLNTQVF